jgi:hypothetical protein
MLFAHGSSRQQLSRIPTGEANGYAACSTRLGSTSKVARPYRLSHDVKHFSLSSMIDNFCGCGLCCLLIVMVQLTQHRNGANLAQLIRRRSRKHRRVRNPLPKPLMWSSLIKVPCISLEEARELFLMENEEVIQAFSSHASQKTFTDGIRLRSSIGSSKHLDSTDCGHSRKTWPKFLVIIPDEICGRLPVWSRLPQRYAPPRHRSVLVSHSRA